GRRHTAAQTEEAYALARAVGFRCINMDLIAGLPTDDVEGFRYSLDKVLLELPAGKLEKGEDPASCAKRELQEEIGLTAKEMISLGEVYPTVGYCDEIIRMYAAFDFEEEVRPQNLDEDEFLEIVKMPFETVYQMVLSGEIKDAKTQIGILKAAALLRQKQAAKNM
ncbi:MAG: NUDIX domain-containing protein, partial [Oscillospiraceae bacterium]|nr:NUDIX domain-containing protein [Oscillospiraceae bacterium]